MKDEILMWSVWLTSIMLVVFLIFAAHLAAWGEKDEYASLQGEVGKMRRQVEAMRMQVLQLEQVNRRGLAKLKR